MNIYCGFVWDEWPYCIDEEGMVWDIAAKVPVCKFSVKKVYDVAWSDDRKPDNKGVLPAVGNTVDVKAANWTNTIGASELGVVWADPDFNPEQKAFYYARVIEIPTPRWIVYDAFRYGVDIPQGAKTTHQERAYTSPIWYTP
mgnify:CR=1 FL=1